MPPLEATRVLRRRAGAALLVTAVGLSACTGTSASPSDDSRPSADSSAASAAPSAKPPVTSFSFDSDEPVISREEIGTDESFINPGAVFEHDGQFHMFANLFTAFPGPSQVPYLTSPDGRTWTLSQPDPVFSSDQVDFAPNGAQVSAGFVTDDGTWVLIFETLSSLEPWQLGRATAPAPEGPWTVDPDPILVPGEAGSLDAGGLSWPTVVRTDAGYAMYYTAVEVPRGDGVIAMATSADGVRWTKADEPVLAAEAPWEDGSVDRPRVVVTSAGLAMVYAGRDLTDRGIAYSDDGISWQRDGDQPVISQDDFPVDGRCWDATLLNVDRTLHYILEIGSASTSSGGTELYLATAPLP